MTFFTPVFDTRASNFDKWNERGVKEEKSKCSLSVNAEWDSLQSKHGKGFEQYYKLLLFLTENKIIQLK